MAEQRLKDRIALITGASRGIGAETAKVFATAGANLIAMTITSIACVLLFFYPDPFYELAMSIGGTK